MEIQQDIQPQKQEPQTWPKVAIIVLNWNGWQDTIECLESLQRLTYPRYQIIVVDNGSTDESVRRIKEKFPHLTLIETGKNLGYGGGNNVGITYGLKCGADYVLILNNDTIVEPNALTTMVEVAEETNASVVGALIKDYSSGKILFSKSSYPAMFFYSEPQRDISGRWWSSDRVEGSAMLLRRELLLERQQSLGYFLDESLFLYCEEIELAMWCRRVGRKSVVAGDAVVYHKVGRSSGGKAQPAQFYYLTRNRMLIARRHLQKFPYILFLISYSLWRFIRAGMYLAQGKGKIAFAILLGVFDGFKGKTGARP